MSFIGRLSAIRLKLALPRLVLNPVVLSLGTLRYHRLVQLQACNGGLPSQLLRLLLLGHRQVPPRAVARSRLFPTADLPIVLH